MILKDRLKIFSQLKIDIGTKFKENLIKDDFGEEDITEQLEKDFHHACLQTIEEFLTEDYSEEFCREVIRKVFEENDYGDLSKKIEDFSDFGRISIEVARVKDTLEEENKK